MHKTSVLLLVILIWFAATVRAQTTPPVADDDPTFSLREQIDQALMSLDQHSPDSSAGRVVDDAGFLRRITLDLAGRIPTAVELNSFVSDSTSEKRPQMIESLLDSPQYARRMRDQMHVMLMERLGDDPAWLDYLETAFAENRPWDQICREILDPAAGDEARRGAAFFWTRRLEKYGQNPVDHPALTRDVGRLFLGVDLQCAQCHDHLFVHDYTQASFQGLAAFTGHTFIRNDVAFPAVGEKVLTAPVEFASVFSGEQMKTGPRLPGGNEVEIPTFTKDEQFAVPPDKATKFPGQPRFRPLAVLAQQVTAADNQQFAVNSVNRFWFLMFGRGLVMPLDLHHSDNPPTHPELLQQLASEFKSHGYDIRWLLREIAQTQAYQASSRMRDSDQQPTESAYAVAWERSLSAEQLLASFVVATGQQDLMAIALADGQNTGESDSATDAAAAAAAEKWMKQLGRFRDAFANIPRDPEVDYRPSVKASLFLMNDASLVSWFEPHSGSTVEQLVKLSDNQIPTALYQTALSRDPTAEETEFVGELLATRDMARERMIGHLLWGLLASSEFSLNH
ncbi:MAG: DUF1553 domain-containing protein [Planctomycetaceae bacterium]|nr:DUF1553 domain-containing protein [Planctomycetaceae bacterium]